MPTQYDDNDDTEDDEEEVTIAKKVKKTVKKRKIIDVIYLNDLPTELVVKTLRQKVQEKYRLNT
jgi:hypothetical protein